MMLAVGAYSGPRTVFGAVAHPTKNARHVTAALRRIDILVCRSFISEGGVSRGYWMLATSLACVRQFLYRTLGLLRRSFLQRENQKFAPRSSMSVEPVMQAA